ncbi:putative 8-amino-7-oxononanoate synthase [Rubellimicrobium mesophilum DSM 19309]|uniref:Putative 8-amino-7-oxononanoate synthase n=1 Tax=Rubellimicrobium mesophilum DSM 19309 TaxID=442562 RepID=A0A017HNM1_9RHOB|nr:pyridoxal phosphate-dependent aminotransferase family protein [Rubellimicrobium mesophilum]EYD75389.1 putative 8-amino-7-oxononanoate synthase [Rubellimicrobium mesophilum DSM 19309]
MSSSKPIDIHDGISIDYVDARTTNLLDRWIRHAEWWNARGQAGLDSYARVTTGRIAPRTHALDRHGRAISGLNFASQDYLSLTSHPRVIAAAQAAAERYGVHSAGSAALMGLTPLTCELEERLAAFLGLREATVFPTGWGAGYGAIRTLVRPGDHIVLDALARTCLQEAANMSGAEVHRVLHCSPEAVARRLTGIRKEHPRTGILVVTEGVFSIDSDIPDIAALQDLCREHEATLIVDVAHDLGALGETGRGVLEEQGMVGKVDVVTGSFSKAFASNGGFVATNHPALKLALRHGCGPLTFTNTLSPAQAAAVLECLSIVESREGVERRQRLRTNLRRLRRRMTEERFDVLGQPSALVPVVLGGSALARVMTAEVQRRGAS